ncbi:MAG TPA: inositol monophosphatase family protein [Gaiellaceae bacterium]|nr:inositol monophosphatase family protein [Gaiellaceae bacterium]
MLSDAELDDCVALLDELARFACERIVAERPSPEQIGTKTSAADWVTETDVAVERHVRAAVLERFPSHRVVGEELGAGGSDEPAATWYVDPVDGTTNFVHGLPWSSFSLAVSDEVGAAAGVVVDPYRREVLSAVRGRGAAVDGTRCRCSDATTITGGILLTELVAQSLWPGMGELMAACAAEGCVTRILGSNALTLASVGAGRAVAAVLGSYGPLDGMAGTLIAREAGARVVASSGGAEPVEGEALLCAAPGVAGALLELWRTHAGRVATS